MSKRKTDPATYEMTEDEAELSEPGEAAERVRRTLEDNGITRADVFASLPEAKRRTFKRNYPKLVAENNDESHAALDAEMSRQARSSGARARDAVRLVREHRASKRQSRAAS